MKHHPSRFVNYVLIWNRDRLPKPVTPHHEKKKKIEKKKPEPKGAVCRCRRASVSSILYCNGVCSGIHPLPSLMDGKAPPPGKLGDVNIIVLNGVKELVSAKCICMKQVLSMFADLSTNCRVSLEAKGSRRVALGSSLGLCHSLAGGRALPDVQAY
jgi:hypothetical protein